MPSTQVREVAALGCSAQLVIDRVVRVTPPYRLTASGESAMLIASAKKPALRLAREAPFDGDQVTGRAIGQHPIPESVAAPAIRRADSGSIGP